MSKWNKPYKKIAIKTSGLSNTKGMAISFHREFKKIHYAILVGNGYLRKYYEFLELNNTLEGVVDCKMK